MISARHTARFAPPALVALLAMATCGSNCGGTTTGAILTSVEVTPTNPTIARGTSAQLTATGTYSDDSTKDVTAEATWASSDPTTAKVSDGGLVTGLAPGSATASAVVFGITGTTSVTVTPATLVSIAVTPTSPAIAAGTTAQFAATGTYSDNTTQDITGQVTWASSDGTKATISATGLATGVVAGPTTISATTSGKTGLTVLTVTPAILVSIAVTPANPALPVGLTRQFTATGTYSDNTTQDLTGQVTWASSDTTKATMSSAGLATGVAAGPTTVTAATSGTSGLTMLTVTPATLVSIAVTPANPAIAAGTKQQFVATGTLSDGTKQDISSQATWASSDSSKAVISNAAGSKGLATSLVPGTTSISAGQAGITGATLLTVTPATLVSIAVTPANPSIAAGTPQQFVATGTFSDSTSQDITAQVTWASSDSTKATISNAAGSQGLATSLVAGTTSISAGQAGITGATLLTVTPATLVSIAVTPTNPAIANGTTEQFTASGRYSDKTIQDVTAQVTWASSDSSVATVSNATGSRGLASAVGVGFATVSASLSGTTGTTVLTVTPATLVSIAVTPPMRSMPAGLSQQFAATGTYTDGTTQDLTTAATWASTNPEAATISNAGGSQGVAATVAQGTTSITATSGGVVSAGATLLVTGATIASVAIDPPNPQLPLATTLQLTATGTYSDASTFDVTSLATWGTDVPTIAAVSNAAGSRGLATALSQGTAVVSASFGGVGGTTALTVTPAALVSIAVTPSNPPIAKGTTIQFTAVGTYTDNTTQDLTGNVAWETSDLTVATVSNAAGTKGLASGIAVGSVTVSAALSGKAGTATLTVTPATLVSLAVTPAGAAIAKGTTQQFAATGTYTDNSTQDLTAQVTWASSDGTVASVSNAAGTKGLATGLGIGPTSISATLGSVSGSTSFSVSVATLVSISLSPASPAIANGTQQQFTATGIYTDNSTQDLTSQASWSSSDQTRVSISNSAGTQGLAGGLAVGASTVSATFGGKTGSTLLTVTAATLVSIGVTPTTPSVPVTLTVSFSATGTYTDNSTQDLTEQVTWSSSNGAVASVSNASGSQGLATALSVGTAGISATMGSVSGSTALTVNNATLSQIVVGPGNAAVPKGLAQQYQASGIYSDNSQHDLTGFATWASSNPAVGQISNASGSRGLVAAIGTGSATIIATYLGVASQAALTVTAASLVSIGILPVNPSVPSGNTEQFQAIGTYTDNSTLDITAAVAWSSSDTTAAEIGAATGLAQTGLPGSTVISAAQGSVGSTTVLTVTSAALKAISIEPPNPSLPAGTNIQLTATGIYTDSTTQDITTQVTWSSSNPLLAAVSNAAGSAGLATGVSAGTVAVGAALSGIAGSTTMKVTPAVLASIAVAPPIASIAMGTRQQFTATGTYSDGSTKDLTAAVTWTSGGISVATVSNQAGSEGLASGVGQGSASIVAALGSISSSATLTVTAATLVSVAVTPANPSIARGTTTQFTAIGTYTDGTTQDLTSQITWSSSDEVVASVSNGAGSPGLATGLSVGASTITATLGAVSGTTTLSVTSAVLMSIAIAPPTVSIPKTGTAQFTATGTFSDSSTQDLTTQVSWSSSDLTVLSISNAAGSQGLATALSSGAAVVTAAMDGIQSAAAATVP